MGRPTAKGRPITFSLMYFRGMNAFVIFDMDLLHVCEAFIILSALMQCEVYSRIQETTFEYPRICLQIQKDERNECRGKKRNVCSSSMCFRGKSFSTYVQAKKILKFIIDVVATVNHDPDIGDLLKERSKGKIKRVEVKIGMIVDEYSLEGTPVTKIAIGTYLSHHTWARKGSVPTKKGVVDDKSSDDEENILNTN
ncbi:alpha-1,4 glucan phosphorylase L-2 isozyme, chloroplastic/amyloplastic [Tanacetum coccineum]|uniref:Alpha-1,4 glucan phosphorylase L-2 isozyme, chloroplastic/amyloplastic n=1 Tax=Tanacetum coccineum TaxID=301880 RepID=A0ABQ5FHZ2_9ASTR